MKKNYVTCSECGHPYLKWPEEAPMTSQQVDIIRAAIIALDEVVHAVIQDHPSKARDIEDFSMALGLWSESNPVPELKP